MKFQSKCNLHQHPHYMSRVLGRFRRCRSGVQPRLRIMIDGDRGRSRFAMCGCTVSRLILLIHTFSQCPKFDSQTAMRNRINYSLSSHSRKTKLKSHQFKRESQICSISCRFFWLVRDERRSSEMAAVSTGTTVAGRLRCDEWLPLTRVAISEQQLIMIGKCAVQFLIGFRSHPFQSWSSRAVWTSETFWIPSLVCMANHPWTRAGIFHALSVIVIKGIARAR